MEEKSNSQNIQLPPGYVSIDETNGLAMRENIMIISLKLMQRIENFARSEFDKLRRRGVTVEYIVHSDELNDGVQVDIFIKAYKSNIEEKILYLVLEEATKRIENFARAVMNIFRYRGLLINHYFFHKYDSGAIHLVVGVEVKGIRLDLFKKLEGKRITLSAEKFLNEMESNEQMALDKRKLRENYVKDMKEENEKIRQILDSPEPKNAEDEIDDFDEEED